MVITREGYIIPLQVKDGLCYMKMRPPTDEELSSLPHVIVTSDDEWDPSAVDNDGPNLEGIENHADVVRIREQQDWRLGPNNESLLAIGSIILDGWILGDLIFCSFFKTFEF